MIEFTNRSFGANLIASDINLEIGGNLLLKSRQNLSESDSYNIGMSLGISSNSSGVGGGSIGLNLGNGYSNRAWVDQISSIIGTNSVTINTANNTNIVGALIANIKTPSPLEGEGWGEGSYDGGNLTINTGSLTYSDLKNFSVSESSQLGLNLSIGFKADEPTAPQNSESAQKNKGVIPGNLKLDLALNSQESSSDSKATIGLGNITVGGILNDETKLANLNRDINNSEQNKNTVITSDFESSLTLDTRLIAAAFYSASGAITGDEKDSQNAVNNLGSYVGDAKKGAKITGHAIAIPAVSIYNYARNSDLAASDAIYATGKNYSHLYNLAYNPNIDAKYFVGDANILSYNGESLKDGADAKGAEGFYDRRSDVAAINFAEGSNQTNSNLAGTLAHEGVHREMNQQGRSYNNSEEITAHMVGDFVAGSWDSFQMDNTSLRSSVPSIALHPKFLTLSPFPN